MARAFGSYPECHWFESSYRYQWPVGQEVKTLPFHGSNTSSSLVQVTKLKPYKLNVYEAFIIIVVKILLLTRNIFVALLQQICYNITYEVKIWIIHHLVITLLLCEKKRL